MASLNDFKILNKKCESYFKLLESELGETINLKSDVDKQRFGFYFYMIECICNILDFKNILDTITDTDFNRTVFNLEFEDHGVDAIYIDSETNTINLFNFKFREKFNPTRAQNINETILSTKLVNAILNEDTSALDGKIRDFADQIIKKLNSKIEWNLKLYVVSNDNEELNTQSATISQLEKTYDLEVVPIGLPKIAGFMSMRPKPVNATLVVERDSIMSYSESSLSSAKSYVFRISIPEFIRITCDDNKLRDNFNLESVAILNSVQMDYALLFDNVRGFLGETKYNKNIIQTLKDEPGKFFLYNNGITITAENIEVTEINQGKMARIRIENFQIVNGGQTLKSIHKFNNQDPGNIREYLHKGEILVRAFRTGKIPGLINKIAEYTNSQNAISVIDLKSLTEEQIQIEQFLDENQIVYLRKVGDTGAPDKEYQHRMSMEKFAQILYSKKGFPEKASAQKKAIFEKHYDLIFKKDFKLEESAGIVKRYYEIKKIYEGLKKPPVTDQKIFYIFYMDQFFNSETTNEIEFLEKTLKVFDEQLEEPILDAKKLIRVAFKEFLDKEIEKRNLSGA